MTNEQAIKFISKAIYPCSSCESRDECNRGHEALCDGAMYMAIAALRAQDTPNQPLTLEEVRGMDGEPVWIEPMQQWRIVAVDHGNEFVKLFTVFNTISAKSILNDDGRIYRRKPEEE
ncbi:MAG: hypothetical protein RSB39_09415 [Oscillospiraceae bacterium]